MYYIDTEDTSICLVFWLNPTENKQVNWILSWAVREGPLWYHELFEALSLSLGPRGSGGLSQLASYSLTITSISYKINSFILEEHLILNHFCSVCPCASNHQNLCIADSNIGIFKILLFKCSSFSSFFLSFFTL